ncbi:MAG TPA: heme-binding beta-barrel domain-containing protein [Cyclobacteriaceae bacterium]|nr:heme-binding beta-barrel domain-containing protein [Cyclobacteriaceae bacterium]
MKYIVIALIIVPQFCLGQLSKSDSVWLPLLPLIGKWTGTGEGPEGKGSYERSYSFVLNKKFIEVRNKAVYPATKEKPKGYIHEDYGYISYDKGRKKFVFRQFHGEGFVNEYLIESISADGKTIVFVTESIENIPNGWRGRETYKINGNTLTEDFDLAEPGKDFEAYTKVSLTRSK